MKRLVSSALGALVLLVLTAGVALGHTGHIKTDVDCKEWEVKVFLDHNTTPDRRVDVLTDIPGTTGIENGHFDESYGLIWEASGSSPTSGTVTLVISVNQEDEFRTSASIEPKEGCATPTPSPTETQQPTPSPSVTVTPSPTPSESASATPEPTATPPGHSPPVPTLPEEPTPSPSIPDTASTGTECPQMFDPLLFLSWVFIGIGVISIIIAVTMVIVMVKPIRW